MAAVAGLGGLAHGGTAGAVVELALVVGLGAIVLLVLITRRRDGEEE